MSKENEVKQSDWGSVIVGWYFGGPEGTQLGLTGNGCIGGSIDPEVIRDSEQVIPPNGKPSEPSAGYDQGASRVAPEKPAPIGHDAPTNRPL